MIAPLSKKNSSVLPNPKNFGQVLIGFGATVILTSLVVTGAIIGLRQGGFLEGYELEAYDSLIRSSPESGPDERLVVVEITQDDIRKQNEFPIWDDTLARLLQRLEEYQPRAIGIDIGRDVPIGEGRDKLQKVLKENDNIIAACILSSVDEPGTSAAPGVPPERIGFADLPQDIDAKIRRTALVSIPAESKVPIVKPHLCNYVSDDNQIPSFAFSLALLYLQGDGIEPEQTEEGYIKLGPALFKPLEEDSGGYFSTGATDYQIMIDYRSAEKAVQLVTLSDVLEKKVDPALLRNRIVLVGYTASTVNDDFPTPYSAGKQARVEMPGVIIHAQIVSQILSTVWNNRPLIWYWPQWSEMLWIFGWSVVGGTLAWKIRRPWIFIPVAGVAIAILYNASYQVFLRGGWIPLVPPGLGLVVTAGSVLLIDRYAQAVYQGVKKLLRIDITIDQTEKAKQVAEITESETFLELQQKAAELRNRKKNLDSLDTLPSTSKTLEEKPANQEPELITSSDPEDYLQGLQQRGRRMRKKPDDELSE
ncbi:MAG TPA: transmembrane sensor domain protein [Cyanobacteria bacterium UBA12227]|nr:transmembrane sensor domain protein [Cyanobacteria bacterium UBA12227]HAX87625.1 transmembrane sensor domain protein [Cyanobacteria bacterium UBA11370]